MHNPRPRDAGPWNWLAIQCSLFGKSKAKEKACLRKPTVDHIQNNGTASKLSMEAKPERERDHRKRSTVRVQTPGDRVAARKPDRSMQIAGNSEQASSR